jgi:transposase InsO family protein
VLFFISKRTIYRWQKLLKESQGRLESLNPQSRKPLFIYPRKSQHNAYIERFNGILQKEFINHYFSLVFQNLE